MGTVCWDFPILGTASMSGSNNAAITMFKGTGIMDGLAREICQNSLDAKNRDLPDVPVRVKFSLSNLKKSEHAVFTEYEEYVQRAVDYWESNALKTEKIDEFLEHICQALDKEYIPMLTISDYNTTGLNGVNAGPSERSYWKLLLDTEGISIKPDDISAGSFGIGKNAPFAYSSLNMVFYNTYAQDGGRAFEGVTHMVTTQRMYNGTMRATQSSGKYLYLEDEYSGRPIKPSDSCDLAKIPQFQRNEIGTDVAIIGFKLEDYPEWEKNTAIAIIKNFVLAIHESKLEVIIESPQMTYEITKSNLEDLLFVSLKDEMQLKYTRQTYETITKTEPIMATIAEDGDLSIYVRYSDDYLASLSRFRSTGMLINTTSESLPHYAIVIVVNDVASMELSKTLREAEPPQHTEWKAKNITENRLLRNRAAKYIRNIMKEIQKVLDEFEKAEVTETIDAGVGNYLPDSNGTNNQEAGNDGLRTDVKISEIEKNDGTVIFKKNYETGTAGTGAKSKEDGVKTGKKKLKRKTPIPIPVVDGGTTGEQGATAGDGGVKISALPISEHRTYYVTANKYRSYIVAPKAYDNAFIQYYAEREDNNQDLIEVKNVKVEGIPLISVNGTKIGPIKLKEGSNIIYVEFANNELMAVTPVFNMEVIGDEKQKN